jgi:tight adherence protein C
VEIGAVPAAVGENPIRRIFGPPLRALADRLGRLIDGTGETALLRKLRQGGLLQDVPASHRVQNYRMRQLLMSVGGATAGFAVGVLLRRSPAVIVTFALLGLVAGASYWRGKLDRAIEDRRNRMRIELYTINQLLAMRVRVGGGVVSAARHVVDRGHGPVVDELAEALRLHQGGMAAGAAFRRVADLTPEPHARRCYQVLATADERGSDLATALLALSEDIRDDRREALRRQATRRRALMLLPIIAILAPILILFVAAPLPWIVLRGFG